MKYLLARLRRMAFLILLLSGVTMALATLAFAAGGGGSGPIFLALDYGDAPDENYFTLVESGGPAHEIVPDFYLGAGVDVDTNGQPNETATGDDENGDDDEDGVTFTSSILIGQTTTLEVVASDAGFLDAWIDFAIDGSFDEEDQIFISEPLEAGVNMLQFDVPFEGVRNGETYVRFRFSSVGGLDPYASPPCPEVTLIFIPCEPPVLPDGEVEDYQVEITFDMDMGDAPDPTYPTLLDSAGAAHLIQPGFFLGAGVDADTDGQPNATATGDDGDGNDDDDGVTFYTSLVPGNKATIEVVASDAGFLDAWLDFGGDGSWEEEEDQIFYSVILEPGSNILSFAVPDDAVLGETFSRFRFSQEGGLRYDNSDDPCIVTLAKDAGEDKGLIFIPCGDIIDPCVVEICLPPIGEVEDYAVEIIDRYDFGDAPAPFPTRREDNGAHHLVDSRFYLGTAVDDESDGIPTAGANGDDTNGLNDERGVVFTSALLADATATIEVTASQEGYLDGWIDFGRDGSWDEAGDHIFLAEPLDAGVNSLSFPVPANAILGNTYARFRYSEEGGLDYQGGLEYSPDIFDEETLTLEAEFAPPSCEPEVDTIIAIPIPTPTPEETDSCTVPIGEVEDYQVFIVADDTPPSSGGGGGGGGGGSTRGVTCLFTGDCDGTAEEEDNGTQEPGEEEDTTIVVETPDHNDERRFIDRAHATALILETFGISTEGVVVTERPYPDVEIDHPFAAEILLAKNLGIVNGYGDGLFRPENNIARAEAYKMFYEVSELPLSAVVLPCTDVNPNAWYLPYMEAAFHDGLLDVSYNNTCRPAQYMRNGEFELLATFFFGA